MLKESYACFATSRLTEAQPPPAARINLNGTLQSCLDRASDQVGIELTKEVEVWPGDVLANLSDDCFYRAAGLSAEELAELGRRSGSLNQLVDRFGREWVFFHVTRLCLLELARLRGV